MKIYYYPSCSTCKKALKWLDNSELKYEKEHIVDANLTRKEIENIYKKSKLDRARPDNKTRLILFTILFPFFQDTFYFTGFWPIIQV